MKKFTIITTYPEFGTQNIGDQLITNSLNSVLDAISSDYKVSIVWREQQYNQDLDLLLKNSDAIIFACLAIKPSFSEIEYPFIDKILDLDIPLYIVSSGTALNVSGVGKLEDYLTEKSIHTLRRLGEKSCHFGVRGLLSYKYLSDMGIKNISFTGDVAFYDPKYEYKEMRLPESIKTIVVSDPHRAIAYKNAFICLINQLKYKFPDANIVLALHGKNMIISELAQQLKIEINYIYKNKDEGLSIYDIADLHIGFRVHAHVSMLKRRKVSYLLEQDGRGCDYGLSIPHKISVPCHQHYFKNLSLDFFKDLIKYRSKHTLKQASVNDVKILMIRFSSTILTQDLSDLLV
ncbi:polysaccharide pyruvyl transferase family protein [Vibrio cyclitrophicus]